MNYKKILIIGNKGQLGSEFQKYFTENEIDFIGVDIEECDISNYNSLKEIFVIKPDVVINCSAFNNVDQAEANFDTAFKVNANGPMHLAELCHLNKVFLIHYSSDYVFDGNKNDLYDETDKPNPINKYGLSKLNGEKFISDTFDQYMIFRLSWVYGNGSQNFIHKVKEWSKINSELKISDDEISIPTSTEFIVANTLKAYSEKLTGLYHLTPENHTSRYLWTKRIFENLRQSVNLIPAKKSDFLLAAKRPDFSAMNSKKISNLLGSNFDSWEFYLDRYMASLN
jgi:dTDP-4-dehydrorhamnose reductase